MNIFFIISKVNYEKNLIFFFIIRNYYKFLYDCDVRFVINVSVCLFLVL